VYPDQRPPEDDKMCEADRRLISLPAPPAIETRLDWEQHQTRAKARLRELTFRTFPAGFVVPHVLSRRDGQGDPIQYRTYEFEAEPGLVIRARLTIPMDGPRPYPVVVGPVHEDARTPFCGRGASLEGVDPNVAGRGTVEVRGTGGTSIGPGLEWTVRRAYPILGHTLPERQTLDLLQGIAVLRAETNVGSAVVYGKGRQAAHAIYAAILDETIAEIILEDPITTHWDAGSEFLNVLKIGDLPHNLALAFPKPVTFVGSVPEAYEWTRELYLKCGAEENVRAVSALSDWRPWAAS